MTKTYLKLSFYLLFTALIFTLSNLKFLVPMTIAAGLLCLLSSEGKRLRAGALPIGLFLAATFLSNALFSDGRLVGSFLGIYVSEEGLQLATLRTSRVFLMIVGAKLLMIYVTPAELREALAKVLSPLRKLKIPVDDFMEILTLTMLAVPLLKTHLIESFKVKNAQNTNGSLIGKARTAASLLVPTLIMIITSPEIIFKETKAL
ncbi:energy-coupling factor transporter transmembrane component T family protein [Candidatus Magnetomonas plexicatena]|uniref:energy-coupling factor transporter transmembrane component T family protein n=1 Tax=Candidatus Magnetomonas plexicatena TaxID=2552947 RepID=UPI0011048414|nr:hypothetical protein E2O03_000165 [Nitrospirales bacterium LBB_01]